MKSFKHHVVVDKNGFLIAAMVIIACIHNREATFLLVRCLKELCCNIKVILTNTEYKGEVTAKIKKDFRICA